MGESHVSRGSRPPFTMEEALEVARRKGIIVNAKPVLMVSRESEEAREATLYFPGGFKVIVIEDRDGYWAFVEEPECSCVCEGE